MYCKNCRICYNDFYKKNCSGDGKDSRMRIKDKVVEGIRLGDLKAEPVKEIAAISAQANAVALAKVTEKVNNLRNF